MVRALAILVGLVSTLAAPSAHARGLRHLQYTVREGDTLHALARRYGCSVQDLQRQNELGKILPVGKKLQIPTCGKGRGAPALQARMEEPRSRKPSEPRVDLGAKRQRQAPLAPGRPGPRAAAFTAAGLRPLGERRRPEPAAPLRSPADEPITRPGDGPVREPRQPATDPIVPPSEPPSEQPTEPTTDPVVPPSEPPTEPSPATVEPVAPPRKAAAEPVAPPLAEGTEPTGQSIGLPWHGRLQSAARLGYGEGYVLRRPNRTYGTATTVAHVERVLAELRQKFPRLHPLAVGDLSLPNGGPVSEHRSHQSGRDIDLGLCFHHRPRGYPDHFVTATEATLNAAATWAMISTIADTADTDGGVAMMFLDFTVQGMVYRWAVAQGIDRDRLDHVFQYPHGRGASAGLVRHEPNHADHLHVRFRCARGEASCQ